MDEDNSNPENDKKPSVPLPPLPPKVVYGVVLLILLAAAFLAGRYSAQVKSPFTPALTQAPPTPVPLGTPIPGPESALTMIDFTGVSEAKKAKVLAEFNSEYCQCKCGMTVATCMVRDPGCPFWKDHVTQFQKALGNGRKPKFTQLPQGRLLSPSQGLVLPQGNSPAPSSLPPNP